MDNRQPKKWHYILFLVIAVASFVVSVISLSAMNNVSGKNAHTHSYRQIIDNRAVATGEKIRNSITRRLEPLTQTCRAESEINEPHSESNTFFSSAIDTVSRDFIETLPREMQSSETIVTEIQPEEQSFIPTDEEEPEEETVFVRTEQAYEGRLDEYAVQESAREGDGFFEDALFIGDSRTQGIQNAGNFGNATFYAYKGLNVITAMKSPFVNEFGEEMMLVDALALHPEFKKIYICFGLNDYWFQEGAFRDKYATLIDAIKEAASPDAQIYMYSVAPVLDGMQKSEEGLNNANIIRFNQIAIEVAKSKGVKFVDVSEAFIKEDGYRYLTDDETPDGIHLNWPGITKICEYLRTHT